MSPDYGCEDCPSTDAHMREDVATILCERCYEARLIARAEAADEDALADGSAVPVTLDEQHAAAWRQRRNL